MRFLDDFVMGFVLCNLLKNEKQNQLPFERQQQSINGCETENLKFKWPCEVLGKMKVPSPRAGGRR